MPRNKKRTLPPSLTPRLKDVAGNPGFLFVGQVLGSYLKDFKGREHLRCRTWSLRKGQVQLSERWVLLSNIPQMMLSAWYRGQDIENALRFTECVSDQSLEIFSDREISKSPVTSRISSKGLMIQLGGGATYTTDDGVQQCRIVNCSWRWGVPVSVVLLCCCLVLFLTLSMLLQFLCNVRY